MRNNIKFVVFLVFLVNVCRALTTVKSTKTLPNTLSTAATSSKNVSTTKTGSNKMYTTELVDSYLRVRHQIVIPENVAKVTMECYGPKGLSDLRKRDGQTTKIVSISKTLPGIIASSTTKSVSKTLPVIVTSSTTKTTPPTKTTTTCDIMCTIERRGSSIANKKYLGEYTIYQRIPAMTYCNVFTLQYPYTTVLDVLTKTKNYYSYSTYTTYPAFIGTRETSLRFYETTSYGFQELNTHVSYKATITARDQKINPQITCTTSDKVTELPYISTKTYDTPISSQFGRVGFSTTLITETVDGVTTVRSTTVPLTTFVMKTEDYITLTSTTTIPVTSCSAVYTTTKQPPVITTTTTTTTKQPPVITTTTTTTSTKQLPVITTTTTTSTTKQPPVITTTTTTSTSKQPPVITTTTTTSTTKQPPVITTTTPTTKCLPITLTVTEKEKVTVTEKVTVYVTVKSEPTHTNNANCAKKWAQCGGIGFNGPTCCESGSVCKELNNYYSQCI